MQDTELRIESTTTMDGVGGGMNALKHYCMVISYPVQWDWMPYNANHSSLHSDATTPGYIEEILTGGPPLPLAVNL